MATMLRCRGPFRALSIVLDAAQIVAVACMAWGAGMGYRKLSASKNGRSTPSCNAFIIVFSPKTIATRVSTPLYATTMGLQVQIMHMRSSSWHTCTLQHYPALLALSRHPHQHPGGL